MSRPFRNTLAIAIPLGVIVALVAVWVGLGLKYYTVGSGSMEPTLPVSSRIIVMPTEELEPGNVITFNTPKGEVVTHTFIGYADDGSVMTKGDANPTPDVFWPTITEADVIGKVVRVFTVWEILLNLALLATLLGSVGWIILESDDNEVDGTPVDEETHSLSPA